MRCVHVVSIACICRHTARLSVYRLAANPQKVRYFRSLNAPPRITWQAAEPV